MRLRMRLCALVRSCGKIDPSRTALWERVKEIRVRKSSQLPEPKDPHGIALALMSATIARESDDGSDDGAPDRRVHLKVGRAFIS